MRNVWTIARKELRSYFDHPTAYIFLVIFLVANFFFYFRSAFVMGEASLRPMFDLLPWFLLIFVSAVTMGALAEERRHGTLEVTLSHPLHEHEFLLGKYVGNLLFIAIGLGGTLLVPLALLLGGAPDFGVVVAQYVGSLLLAAGMVAVGLAASAMTRNQITALILAAAVIFVLMILGTEVVQMGLPSWLAGPAAALGIMNHFANVTRGVIDLRDVVYFVALAAAFLALAYWLMLRDRLSHGSRLYRNLRLGTVAIIAIAVVANLFGGYIPGRLDLTAENLYTMSPGTKQILGDLDDVVNITLYESEELPAEFERLERDVSDVLRDFRRYSDGNVQVLRKHPDASDEARQEATRLGVRPVQFNVVRTEELQVKQGWLGLAVQYAGESEVIPFVSDTRNLEYQLASNIWRLTRTEAPSVAFITGHGEKAASDYGAFARELRNTYEVSTIDLSADTTVIQPDLDAVIVASPRRPFDLRSRAMLESFLANGGGMLYLGEGTDVNLQYLFASALPDSVRDFVQNVGVRLSANLVYDLQSNERISVPGEVFNYIVDYPLWVRALPASEHAITRNLNSVFLPWPSSLDTLAAVEGREITPLLATSEYAGAQRGNFQLEPNQDMMVPQDLGTYTLAVAITGAVAGDGGPPMTMARDTGAPTKAPGMEAAETAPGEAAADTAPGDDRAEPQMSAPGEESPEAPVPTAGDAGAETGASPLQADSLAPATAELVPAEAGGAFAAAAYQGPPAGRAVVVGDSDFLADRFARNSPANIVFALNALDWLTQTEALLGIRSKTPTPRPLVFESSLEAQAVKYINLIGVPLLFVLYGAVRLWRRRRLSRQSYAT